MNVIEKAIEDEEQQKQTNPRSANENSNVTEYYFIAKHIKELLRKNCFIWRHQSTLAFLLPTSPANTMWDFPGNQHQITNPELQVSGQLDQQGLGEDLAVDTTCSAVS